MAPVRVRTTALSLKIVSRQSNVSLQGIEEHRALARLPCSWSRRRPGHACARSSRACRHCFTVREHSARARDGAVRSVTLNTALRIAARNASLGRLPEIEIIETREETAMTVFGTH